MTTPDPTECGCGHSRRVHIWMSTSIRRSSECGLCPCPAYQRGDDDRPAA